MSPGDDAGDSLGVNESLSWLQNGNLTPWPRVVTAWTDTRKKRLTELMKPVILDVADEAEPQAGRKRKRPVRKTMKSSDQKVAEYTTKFRQIHEPQGWTLVIMFLTEYI